MERKEKSTSARVRPVFGVYNGRYPPICIDVRVRWLFQFRELHELGLVRDMELLKDNGHLLWVRTL